MTEKIWICLKFSKISQIPEKIIIGGVAEESPAFAAVIEGFDMPRILPDALLEGLAWDAMGRRYATLSDLRAYSARVASAVGAMMCVLMRVRDRDALARACDLGVAMQLTNIARDVGEAIEVTQVAHSRDHVLHRAARMAVAHRLSEVRRDVEDGEPRGPP